MLELREGADSFKDAGYLAAFAPSFELLEMKNPANSYCGISRAKTSDTLFFRGDYGMGLRERSPEPMTRNNAAVIRLFIGRAGDINTEALDVLVAALDRKDRMSNG